MGTIGDAKDILVLFGLGYLAFKVRKVASVPTRQAAIVFPSVPVQLLSYVTTYLDSLPYHPQTGGESPKEY